ncbi:hypothetical protein RI129_004492 [Pyrocoelia pectoralis]|uniref:Peptidase S1 domain-containing protein n=1 Tax=Pyrocoelia pectoralis TaxID=417401 RepID=A0AAN7ZQB0_9COLE
MKLFVICTLVASAYSLPLDALDSRIFNGRQATLGQFPWQALLYTLFYDSSGMFCGGSLIHTRWVLTAAHCLDSNSRVGFRATHVSMWFGIIDMIDIANPRAVFRNSSEYYIYDDFNHINLLNDIALVKLNEIVLNTENIRPILLGNRLYARSHVKVAGFGRTQEGSFNTKLHYARLKTIGNKKCRKVYQYYASIRQVCAISKSESTCYGDSGSPLVRQKSNGVWKQFGVCSSRQTNVCELGKGLVVFSRIRDYRSWIEDKIEAHE